MFSFFLFRGVNVAAGGFNDNYVFCSLIACCNRELDLAAEVPTLPARPGQTKKAWEALFPSLCVSPGSS